MLIQLKLIIIFSQEVDLKQFTLTQSMDSYLKDIEGVRKFFEDLTS